MDKLGHEPLAQAQSRRRQVFIHIGTHKTGSTSIQHFLTNHAEALGTEGVLIPAAGRHLFGHHLIAWEMRHDERLRGRTGHLQQFFDELRTTTLDRAVISSEDFEYLTQYPSSLRDFVEALRRLQYEPVFIVFFRERAAYLASLVDTLKKLGVEHPVEWYEKQMQQDECIVVRKDWRFEFNRSRFVSAWSEITQAELHAFDFDACSIGHGVVPTFLGAVGVSGDLIEAASRWPRLNARGS